MNCHSCHKDVDYRDTTCYHCGANLITYAESSTDEFKDKAYKANSIFYRLFLGVIFLLAFNMIIPFIDMPGSYRDVVIKYGQGFALMAGYLTAKFYAERERNSV